MCSSPAAAPGFAQRLAPVHHHGLPDPACAPGRQRAGVEQLQTSSGTRQTVITSSRIVNGLQVQVLRDETELEGVRRARDTVLANVSHEFRTPLAAQLASIELLREGLKSSPPRNWMSWSCPWSAARCASRGSSTTCSRVCASNRVQIDVRRQSIELADVVEDARALVEALLRQRRQPLEVSVPAGLELQGDGTRLTQVFVNLIANASKFAPEGTPVRVGARAEGNQISAWVEDSGPGLPDGDVVSIFERFKRGGTQEPSRADWDWVCGSRVPLSNATEAASARHGPTRATHASRSLCPSSPPHEDLVADDDSTC
jgi:signal transduction histidine kinase